MPSQADLGIDYSMARPDHAEMASAGAKFAIRYSAGAASDPGHPSHSAVAQKLITPAEFAELVTDGFDIIANDEWYESRVTEGGKAGAQDGAAARALWASCGLAKGASIYVSWDQAPDLSKWPMVDAYLLAYEHALGGDYHVDIYAGTPYLAHAKAQCLIRYGWRPNAGSWSNDGLPYQPDTSTADKRSALVALALPATSAHIWQTGDYWFNKGADENLILRTPVGSHKEAQLFIPKPKPKPVISDLPTTGEWSTRWTNSATGTKRSAAGWLMRVVALLLDIQTDVKAIRKKLDA